MSCGLLHLACASISLHKVLFKDAPLERRALNFTASDAFFHLKSTLRAHEVLLERERSRGPVGEMPVDTRIVTTFMDAILPR